MAFPFALVTDVITDGAMMAFLDMGIAAHRTGERAARLLEIVGGAVLEPAFKFMALGAGQTICDHTQTFVRNKIILLQMYVENWLPQAL